MRNAPIVLAALLALSVTSFAQLAPPVRIQSADGFIDVTTGHAAPYVMDFDGDGVRDLLVGEFGDGEFPVERLPTKKGKYVHGRLRIYRNHGSNTKPVFKGFEYLMAGEVPASIPAT